MKQNIELLAPAGSLEKLKIAFAYGADAVYAGGEEFSLRAASKNFTLAELAQGIAYAHERGKRVYIAANVIAHNRDLDAFPAFLAQLRPLQPDALIISDFGMFMMARELAPEIPIHISTQANNVNYRTVQAWHELGAKRVVLARELSQIEIQEIRAKAPETLELEAFVHGAMCISYSGRCLLSNYMAGRDANGGGCAHPCRWSYRLVEEKRPGEYMPVCETERGTFVFNSRDLNLIDYIPQLLESGITSLKIEGRVKTEYYVATVVKAYRKAIDDYLANPDGYVLDPMCRTELAKVSNRHYTTGFFNGRADEDSQWYQSSSYVRDYDIVGLVRGFDEASGETLVEQRNRFFAGDLLEAMPPQGDDFSFQANDLKTEDGQQIESAPHAQMMLRMKLPERVPELTILRKRRNA